MVTFSPCRTTKVNVLEDALNGVALDRLRNRQHVSPPDTPGEQHVGATLLDRLGKLARGQRM